MGDAQAGTVIEWLADCFDVGLAAMALAFADQFDLTGLPVRNSRVRPWSEIRGGTS